MVQRDIPLVPVFQDCPVVSSKPSLNEKNYRLVMTYFHPWTLQEDAACGKVPFVSNLAALYAPDHKDEMSLWSTAYRRWVKGHILCRHVARIIRNFWRTFFIRHARGDEVPMASDVSDTPLEVSGP